VFTSHRGYRSSAQVLHHSLTNNTSCSNYQAINMRSFAVLSLLAATAAAKNAVPTLWDGSCYYPQPDIGFNLTSYLGRWYQVAGTPAPYNANCKCTFAQYALNVSRSPWTPENEKWLANTPTTGQRHSPGKQHLPIGNQGRQHPRICCPSRRRLRRCGCPARAIPRLASAGLPGP